MSVFRLIAICQEQSRVRGKTADTVKLIGQSLERDRKLIGVKWSVMKIVAVK